MFRRSGPAAANLPGRRRWWQVTHVGWIDRSNGSLEVVAPNTGYGHNASEHVTGGVVPDRRLLHQPLPHRVTRRSDSLSPHAIDRPPNEVGPLSAFPTSDFWANWTRDRSVPELITEKLSRTRIEPGGHGEVGTSRRP